MAYIGNGRTLLVLGTNVRDDLVPGYNAGTTSGPFDKKEFILSQEVPGGYEQNVLVFRQKYHIKNLVSDTDKISLVAGTTSSTRKIVCTDAAVAAALSSVKEPALDYRDSRSIISISGSSNADNNKAFEVKDVVYNGVSIEIEVYRNNETTETDSSGEILTLNHEHYGYWEVLEAETDYQIEGSGNIYNRKIVLEDAPQYNDKVYVIHKGDATYNLTPSANSVGPDQLSHNLRNFVCDRHTGDGTTATFALSQDTVNAKALLVTVDGILTECDDNSTSPAIVGDWQLDEATIEVDNTYLQTITFHTPPAANAKIRILHLGFSTVSRRAALSPGQVGNVPEGSITSRELANGSVTESKIASNAVTETKIKNDNVTGQKILLNNNESLRAKKSDGVAEGILKVDTSNDFILTTPGTNTIISNGNVGIGQVAPAYKLDVNGSIRTTNDLLVSNNLGVGTTTPTSKLSVVGNASVTGQVAASELVVASSGNVNVKVSANDVTSIGSTGAIGTTSNHPLEITTNSVRRMLVTASGDVGVGVAAPSDRLHVAGALRLDAVSAPTWDTGTRLWMEGGFGSRYDGIAHRFDVGNTRTEAMRITTAGNVGIGISNPSSKLHVAGDITASGTINASGNLSVTDRLGIGINPPRTKLHVCGTTRATAGYAAQTGTIQIDEKNISNLSAAGGLEFQGSDTGAGSGSKIVGFDNGSLVFAYRNNSATWSESFRIDNTGNIGLGGIASRAATIILDAQKSSNSDLFFAIRNSNSGSLAHTGLLLGNDSNTYATDIRLNSSTSTYLGGANSFNILHKLNAPITISTNASERLRITGSGNVGIGTTTPTALLEVKGSFRSWSDSQGDVQITHASLVSSILASNNVSLALGANNVAAIRISTNGNVGIGTASPGEKLQVNGVVRIDAASTPSWDTGFRLWGEAGFGARYDCFQHRFDVGSSRTEAMRINSAGSVGIGTTTPQQKLEVSGGRIRISNATFPVLELKDTNNSGITYVYRTGDTFKIESESVSNQFVILSNGNVGLGTTSPGTKLEVNGNISTPNTVFSGAVSTGNISASGSITTSGNITINNDAPTLFLQDTNNRSAMIHCNSGYLFFLRGTGTNSGAWDDTQPYPLLLNLETKDATFGGAVGINGNLSSDDVTSWSNLDLNATSGSIYLNINSSGWVWIPNISRGGGTSGAVNISSTGALFVPSSSIKYKKDVEELQSSFADNVLKLRPVFYRSKETVDEPNNYSWYGLIAEEVAEIEPRLTYERYTDDSWETVIDQTTGETKKQLKADAKREPDGVLYDRISVLLLDVVKRQKTEIENLKAKLESVEDLKNRLEALEKLLIEKE